MRSRHALVVLLLSSAACGSHLRREVVGHGTAQVTLRGQSAVPGQTIQLPRGTYDIALRFDVPRAQVIDYSVSCGGLPVISGQVGETFERYRERRLAELRAKTERDRRALAGVTGAVVGAVAPNVQAHGHAVGPNGAATVDAQMSGQAVGAAAGDAVAQSAIHDIVDLAPGDVGAGSLQTRVHVGTATDTTCQVVGVADDATVVVSYELTKIRDLEAEKREARIAADKNARAVREQLTLQLKVAGADPHALQRRRDAEAHARAQAAAAEEARRAQLRAEADARNAQLRAEADARNAQLRIEADARRARERAAADARRAEADDRNAQLRAEADARRASELDARLRVEAELHATIELRMRAAMETRTLLVAYLAGTCNADPNKRARERAEEARIAEQRELKIRLELQAKLELEARLRAERDAREARLRAERDARDAKRRAELQAKAEFEADQRRAREFRLQQEREARLALEIEARRRRDEEAARRVNIAFGVRAELQAYLVGIGARKRPPMPALIAENPGIAPFDGATWTQGHWTWNGTQWMWIAGGWSDATTFGASGSAGGSVIVNVPTSVTIQPPVYTDPTITVTPDVPVQVPVIRDHRTSSEPVIRDHRSGQQPTVRDHRNGKQDEPTVRDHRKKDDGPTVRDHRKR